MERGGFIYILANPNKTVLYIGVTSDLANRIIQHKNNSFPSSFTSRYNIHRLVYYKGYHSIEEAIIKEKRLKGSSRKKKIKLIEEFNPEWKDLFQEII